MKAMRVVVSLGECCFPSSRTLALSASPRPDDGFAALTTGGAFKWWKTLDDTV